jgi:hypothetical protein
VDVQTTTVPGVIMFKSVKFVMKDQFVISIKFVPEKETTEISVPEPLIYSHLAVLHNMVITGWTVRVRILVGTRFFPFPDRPWGPPSLL